MFLAPLAPEKLETTAIQSVTYAAFCSAGNEKMWRYCFYTAPHKLVTFLISHCVFQ
jgi:hypothetical protein